MDQDDDFGALLEENLKQERKRLKVGEKVRATVVQVGQERLILDLGGGHDGLMDLGELGLPGERPEVKAGDLIEAYVLRIQDRVADVGMTMRRATASPGGAHLEQAKASGVPVVGVVVEVNKGGYVVEVGGTRCFCPMGAMDMRRIEDPAVMVGRKLEFRVTEAREGRDFVLSRRVLLEEDNARKAEETRGRLFVGARLSGTVRSIRDFGAFVDLGGIDGLVPASEIGHGRARPDEALKVGDIADVQVIRMETAADGKERITLSMKALQADPFEAVGGELNPGMIVVGSVVRVQPFGAFVELVPGVDGLIHVSAFGKRIGHPSEMVKPGQEVAVRVEGVDLEARRVSLYLADAAELAAGVSETTPGGVRVLRRAEPVAMLRASDVESASAPARSSEPSAAPSAPAGPALPLPKMGDVVDVTVDRVEPFGVFVSWPAGRGLVPGRELGVPRGTDLRRQFREGTAFKAVVIDIRDDGKLTLSKTAVERAEERADMDAYRQQAKPAQGGGFGTLGDMLKDKLRR